MKTQKIILTLGVATALVLIAGCDSKPVNNAVTDATKKTEGVAAEVGKAVEGVKPAVEQAVTDAKNTATAATAEASAKATSIIDQAKALVGQNKYSEALTSLGGLTGIKLSAEQEKLVTGLKEQITKAMSGNGAKAAGNLLKQ